MSHIMGSAGRRVSVVAVLVAAVAGVSHGADYYFSPSGNDSYAVNSQATPWATVTKFDSLNLSGGDHVYFQGGATFSGGLYLDQNDTGSAANPIAISSYGTGRATFSSGGVQGFFAYNTGGLNLSNLNFVGDGSTSEADQGVLFYHVLPNTVLSGVHLSNIDVSNYGGHGVSIVSWDNRYGYHDPAATQGWNDVQMNNVVSHSNGGNGIYVWGQSLYSNHNVTIDHSQAYNNGGNGILIAHTDVGTIQRSVAHNNGWATNPVGIWTYDSNRITIQHNESYGNTTPNGQDGCGFDLDGGVTNSVMQYNYSHDNNGAGYLLGEYVGSSPTTDNVIRYNISQNDGSVNSAGIAIYDFHELGKVTRNSIYNNTIFNRVSTASAITMWGNLSGSDNKVMNNIIQTADGVPLIIDWTPGGGVSFLNNVYYSTGSTFTIRWGGVDYHSLADWRNAAGQETLNSLAIGLAIDPKLLAPGAGGTIGNADLLAALDAYRLQSDSPLGGAGMDLSAAPFYLNAGGQDCYGLMIQSPPSIGASEVPEPGCALAALGVLALAMKRRRQALQ